MKRNNKHELSDEDKIIFKRNVYFFMRKKCLENPDITYSVKIDI